MRMRRGREKSEEKLGNREFLESNMHKILRMMRNSEIEGRATARPRLMEFDGGGGGEVQGIAASSNISGFGFQCFNWHILFKLPLERRMSRNYDNWERLVAAVLRKEQLWQLFHEDSRSPSLRSEASSSSSSSFRYLDSPLHDLPSFSGSFTYKVQPKLVFVSDSSPVFVFEDLLGASAKLLGHGTFGSTYSAAMDNGITVVVKELNLLSMSEVEFKRHMELVQDIRHKNVVELRAYFYSKDEKLMLYDRVCTATWIYYSYHLIYSITIQLIINLIDSGRTGENRENLVWETRKRIAVGAARCIAYIHTQRGAKLVHGNIKASNVFLDAQQYGCVSDFGLTNMIPITFLNTARYHAPEVNSSLNVSQASDVYNFGILLLELLTRKSSNQDFDIVLWVNSVKRKEWTAKIFDVDLLKNPAIEDQMVKMLQIGIRCVARAPKKRPKMSAILKTIEEISNMNTKNYISRTVNQNNKLVFFDDLDHGFDLEELLGSSAESLGKGTFGTSYKVILDNGISFVVKRMKETNLVLKEFQQSIELIGKLRHNNVSKLKAYFYSKDEHLLVYDYYVVDNVFTLPGGSFVYKSAFGWEERLRVAVGAARGIAYIHRQDGTKLVHGNIKASNIFLNAQKYGCVTDAGLSMLTSQLTVPDYLAAGYRAPEVTHTKTVSQASDVYSFGVVLIELVSGKTSQITTEFGEVVSLVTWIHSTIREEWTNEVLDIKLFNDENEEKMVRLLLLAMRCVVIYPEDRPKMPEVVRILEEISGINTRLEHLLPMLTLHNE
ncbi:hypothetical protein RD792_005447 [Penstemon davidsonii]|uniref:Protein kinase domain-containing protein n=1 Tax=Penstemon davidsonii TaxID=160366 RepID=A0ABR0DK66_9LAMI|nr:hypothetical protein RD792_005447 [Penstemon davidsonii]